MAPIFWVLSANQRILVFLSFPQRIFSILFHFLRANQREIPFFSNQRHFALKIQREIKGCCRHVWLSVNSMKSFAMLTTAFLQSMGAMGKKLKPTSGQGISHISNIRILRWFSLCCGGCGGANKSSYQTKPTSADPRPSPVEVGNFVSNLDPPPFSELGNFVKFFQKI